MANPFVAEIRIFAGNFAPRGWQLCNGQLLAIASNTALFSLLGTTYGGNGTSTFALPNLQGMAPMHWGSGPGLTPRVLGETGGEANVTLLANQVPTHRHTYNAGSGSKGENNTVANEVNCDEASGSKLIYATTTDNSTMAPGMITPTAASLPHQNMQPFLGLSFIIATQGVYPPRS
jgi:microcystin-dependent protein